MQRIEFSEMTNRLHRNLVAVAALIIIVVGFDIKIGKATTSGLELENLTTGVLLLVLVALLIYHALAFSIRAFEEYQLWQLKLSNKEATFYGGGTGILELADQMKAAGESLEKVIQNSGAIGQNNQNIFTETDARQLRETAQAALHYGKRFKNFPIITRIRFWVWDIGLAAAISLVALAFAGSALPSGLLSRCL